MAVAARKIAARGELNARYFVVFATVTVIQAMRDSGKTATVAGMRVDDALMTGKGGHGAARQQLLVSGGDVVNKRLWTGATKASASFATNMIAPVLVGTPEQIVDALGDYHDLGITGCLASGFDMIGDIAIFGRHVILLLRKMADGRQPRVGGPQL